MFPKDIFGKFSLYWACALAQAQYALKTTYCAIEQCTKTKSIKLKKSRFC